MPIGTISPQASSLPTVIRSRLPCSQVAPGPQRARHIHPAPSVKTAESLFHTVTVNAEGSRIRGRRACASDNGPCTDAPKHIAHVLGIRGSLLWAGTSGPGRAEGMRIQGGEFGGCPPESCNDCVIVLRSVSRSIHPWRSSNMDQFRATGPPGMKQAPRSTTWGSDTCAVRADNWFTQSSITKHDVSGWRWNTLYRPSRMFSPEVIVPTHPPCARSHGSPHGGRVPACIDWFISFWLTSHRLSYPDQRQLSAQRSRLET
ncbi:hypothetical protein OF83DRAFT_660548 [Amylostereum chailletii]|nr:hypothetical protein OF83DRAFT_660548 [Amylostereum chailletii]